MAKLGSFYSLCPLIDNKVLLEVSDDPEDGIVIVTLGKNLASRYKISDQRQLTCWRTKEKFSSPVLYCKGKSKYVAVFNQSYLKLWEQDDNLDKQKKYKFNNPIHTLIKGGETILILFQNGALCNLEDAIEERKTLNPVGLNLDNIDHILYEEINDQIYVGLISGDILYWTKFEENNSSFSKIPLRREDVDIRGFVFHNIRNSIHLLTLWSDGSMYSRQLEAPHLEEASIGDLFTVIDSISPKHFISMKSLDENYIALYGANSNEEGAVLTLYNIQFKVIQSKQPFKLFSSNSKIWRLGNNLLVPVGHNLAVVHFQLETEQLAALVGSHRKVLSAADPDVKIVQELEVASWEEKTFSKCLPSTLQSRLDQYVKQGLPECAILEELLPEIFEQNDIQLLMTLLKVFTDISEKYLVEMLNFALDDSCNNKLLGHILYRPFSEVLILPYLRSQLSLDKISNLLKYIHSLWATNQTLPALSYIETHAKLLEWSCAIIDSNYQKIVLSKDKLLIETLENINELVKEYLSSLDTLRAVVPLLNCITNNKSFDQGLDVSNAMYTVEQVNLY
ncbi:unnamed protein product [Phyllotreta striolata]|uniref:Nucleolar protein 11 n=1 Tax=Phyllotreta striolata TaxID=444603 RepID=A0A9N9TEE3_PHYSR|nr:unnamed protein product [Phyllotreta striolata]